MKLLYNDSAYSEKTKYKVTFHIQNVGENHYIRVGNKSFENVEQLKYLGTNLINQNSIQENIRKKTKVRHGLLLIIKDFLSFSLISINTNINTHRTEFVLFFMGVKLGLPHY